MADCHEKLIKDFELKLVGKIPQEIIDIVSNCLILVADAYEVQDRCTELVQIDTSNEQYMKMYLSTCIVEGKRERTIERYARELRVFNLTINKKFEEVTTYDIRKYFAMMIGRGNSKRTVENVRSCLSPFFRWMNLEDIIDNDPMLKIKPIKYEDKHREPFTDVEISMLQDASDIFDRAIVEFLLSTGARLSEASNMKLSDIDFRTNTVFIKDGKGGKDRTTYIKDVAIRYLQEYLNNRKQVSEYVFTSRRGGNLTPAGIEHRLKTLGKRAGVTNVYPHRFRHTFASNLAKAGMRLEEIQILLGHTNIGTTTIYVTTSQNVVKNRYLQLS